MGKKIWNEIFTGVVNVCTNLQRLLDQRNRHLAVLANLKAFTDNELAIRLLTATLEGALVVLLKRSSKTMTTSTKDLYGNESSSKVPDGDTHSFPI